MTIRFIKSWNGYYEGQVVTSPSGGNSEAALISMGYAVADLDGPDNSPVTLTYDPATGKAYAEGVEVAIGGGGALSYIWSAGATVANLTTTRQGISTGAGARSIRAQYSKVSGTPTGTGLRVVFNAINDTDAATKLVTAGQYFSIPLGDSRQFDFASGSEVVRVDYATDAATEAGVTSTIVEYGV